MSRICAAGAAVVALLVVPVITEAQEWNDARVTALVTRATERRARQLADTGLTDYTATALGSLTFLAQVGEGFPDPPKVVKADQIGLEVYWRAPNHSKQLILGRRDTLLLPTDIQYHRDHLGIVQNNFPGIIRLGDGDEVRDVPHPLSAAGLLAYDFAMGDSMRLEVPGQVIEVFEVHVRPKNDRLPAAVGSLYLARADAQVVRMAISFTRAALIDPQLEDVAVVLDNALIEERFWLPRRQEIEIRRSGTWLDFPARGIIRGGFEVCCYRINTGTPGVRFTGPEIDLAPAAQRAAWQFPRPLREVVTPEVAASSDEVARVQARALALVGQTALARARDGALLAGSISDLARFNRAEGLSLGGGVRRRIGPSLQGALTGRYALAAARPWGSVRFSWFVAPGASLRIGAFDEVRDAADVAEVSGVRNSLGAQEYAADFTEPYRQRGFEARYDHAGPAGIATLGVTREWSGGLDVEATPARGTFRALPDVRPTQGWRADVGWFVPRRPWLGGTATAELRWTVRRRTEAGDVAMPTRVTARLEVEQPRASGRLVVTTFAGVTSSSLSQDSIRAGGPVTGPGYAAHQFVASALLSQRLEWRFPVPFPALPLGRWGQSPATLTLAPHLSAVVLGTQTPSGNRRTLGYPAAGLGALVFFDLIRIDVARGLRNGRWTFGVDITRDLWRIL